MRARKKDKERQRKMKKEEERAMRKRTTCLLAALCFVTMIVGPVFSENEEPRTYEFDVSPGGTIRFDLESGGGVSILGWDKSKAEVSYIQRGKGHKHDIEVLQQRDGLLITSAMTPRQGTSRDLSFQIRLPDRYNVRFESTGGGLKIVDVEGDFTGSTMGGGLTLKGVDGTVKLKTMGGHIEVTSAVLDGSITTMGGTVFLKDVVGDLEAGSMGGNVRYENVRGRDGKLRAPGGTPEGDIEQKTVTISTMGGNIVVDEAPVGALVNTMGGDISVEQASGFVKAQTMGGNINIHVKDGWVDARTMAGEVAVEIDEGLGDGEEGVNLTSCCGDIELVVPSDLSMDLDLTIAYTRNSSQDFEIISDFDVEIEQSKHWDYSNGSPRKRIYGTGKVAGGKYPVVIETTNGNIVLKKAK
jgi:DUF4097 and DUF4098 domain-containing protein YvlB